MNKTTDFAMHLTRYFHIHLPGSKNLSPNTIKSYRDAFKLFILFMNDIMKIATVQITLAKIDMDSVKGYLQWLENNRGCSISTRNQRLAAIHAFYRYLLIENPESLYNHQRILSIPMKRGPKPIITHLSPQEIKDIFDSIDTHSKWGCRDLVLLCVLYDTGARVQELCDLTPNDIRFSPPATVRLHGKGGKTRYVPLLKNTAALLHNYITDNSFGNVITGDQPLFINRQRKKLTRAGVSYVISKYCKTALSSSESVQNKVSPHTFRHSKAMHMYRAGVDLIYIRDILGHVDLSTTEIYAKLDVEQKRKVLEEVYPELTAQELPDWESDTDLMKMLNDM